MWPLRLFCNRPLIKSTYNVLVLILSINTVLAFILILKTACLRSFVFSYFDLQLLDYLLLIRLAEPEEVVLRELEEVLDFLRRTDVIEDLEILDLTPTLFVACRILILHVRHCLFMLPGVELLRRIEQFSYTRGPSHVFCRATFRSRRQLAKYGFTVSLQLQVLNVQDIFH